MLGSVLSVEIVMVQRWGVLVSIMAVRDFTVNGVMVFRLLGVGFALTGQRGSRANDPPNRILQPRLCTHARGVGLLNRKPKDSDVLCVGL